MRSGAAATEAALGADRAALAELAERLELAQQQDADDDEPSTEERDRRARGLDRRPGRGDRGPAGAAHGRGAGRVPWPAGPSSWSGAADEARRRAGPGARRERRRTRQIEVAQAVLAGAAVRARRAGGRAADEAERARAAADAERVQRERELAAVRDRESSELVEEQARLTDVVHRDEVARAEQRMRIDALEARSVEELGVEPDALVAEYGPDQPVPPSPPAPGEAVDDRPAEPQPQVPFVRARAGEASCGRAERALALLGTVNPLALEEFAALEERHRFLTDAAGGPEGVAPRPAGHRPEVDERVEQVFTEAFHDTAREFEGVFARLFPGGEGRLVLTDPVGHADHRASTSRRGRRARRSSGCRCCRAASGR